MSMESAGQYLQWHPTSRAGLYSYSRLWSLWDLVVGVCCSPMGLSGHLAWEDRKEQHENILPLRPPWSAAILSSCLPELNHSSACVHLLEEDIKRDRGSSNANIQGISPSGSPSTWATDLSSHSAADEEESEPHNRHNRDCRSPEALLITAIWMAHSCCSTIHPAHLLMKTPIQTASAIHLFALTLCR